MTTIVKGLAPRVAVVLALALVGCAQQSGSAPGAGQGAASGAGQPGAGAAAPGAAPQPPGPPVEIKIAISSISPNNISIWMAEAQGFFQDEGLIPEVIVAGSGTKDIQMVVAGEAQMGTAPLETVAPANAQGANVRIVLVLNNVMPFSIFGYGTVTSPEQLRGGTIGISTFGSASDIAVRLGLRRVGIDPSQVTIIQIGGTNLRLAALSSGQVEGVPLLEPDITRAKAQGFNPIIDMAALNIPWIFTSGVVSQEYMTRNSDVVTRMIRAISKGGHYALANPGPTKEVEAKWWRTEDPVVLDAAYDEFKRVYVRDGRPSPEGIETGFKAMEEIGIEVKSKEPRDHIDTRILDSLQREGFFDQLKQRFGT